MFQPTEPVTATPNAITIHGAREHNLQDITLSIPRDCLVVVTGVSGSGKSTLAFDLLFAEGQRRFLDSMNVYARQFVEQMARPDVDLITGIPPTVSIEQRNSRGGGKSTVATVTEVHHFIRLLFARLGTQFCPDCQVPVEAQTRDELGRRLQRETRRRGKLRLLAPVVKNRKGFHTDIAEWAARHGYGELRADGRLYATDMPFRLDRFREHNVEIVTGMLKPGGRVAQTGSLPYPQTGSLRRSQPGMRRNLRRGELPAVTLIDATLKLGQGTLLALDDRGEVTVHSTERSCPGCGRSFEPLDPKNFSYNSPQGWCPRCRGFGELFYMPEDVDRGAREDAIAESWYDWQEGQRELCPECGGSRLNPIARAVRLVADFKSQIPDFRSGLTIDALGSMSVSSAALLFRTLKLKGRAAEIARDILPEIRERLRFLGEVGLGYLQLGRGVPTLSGGEAQRIRLAAQLGSNLSGVLYILDEPTIGLHARDNERLLATLERLRSRGNSVLVVEHDDETMRRADYIVDLGPGAGLEGGKVVAAGTLPELLRHPDSITGRCLRTHKTYPTRGERRPVGKFPTGNAKLETQHPVSGIPHPVSGIPHPVSGPRWLEISGADRNNLQNLTVRFPLSRLVCVTGVSGSGKSTLIRECLLPVLSDLLRARRVGRGMVSSERDGVRLAGYESLKAVYEVDQSPIGRTPRSVPATYVGFFDEIRRLFAQLPEARLRGYSPSRFSFNSAQGRCPECEGAGQVKLEMSFLPPAFVRCETCRGCRFTRETLDIEYKGRNIAQVLELSVDEALEFFAGIPKVRQPLEALCDTGLGYLKLGQTSPTLSGGEAQRVKLVTHLLAGLRGAKAAAAAPVQMPGETTEQLAMPLPGVPAGKPRRGERVAVPVKPVADLFVLEEPTIGLHMADVRRLVEVLQRLVDAGHSVVVIEHNLDFIAECDWIIDLGPEGGDAGGRIVAEGTPEQVARVRASHTGRFLRGLLSNTEPRAQRP